MTPYRSPLLTTNSSLQSLIRMSFFAIPSQYASIVGAIYCATKGCLEVANTVFSPLTEQEDLEKETSKTVQQDESFDNSSVERSIEKEENKSERDDRNRKADPSPKKEEKKNKFSFGKVFIDILDAASNARPEDDKE